RRSSCVRCARRVPHPFPTRRSSDLMLIAVTVFPVVFDLLTVAPEDTALGSAGSALVAIGTFVITIAVLLFGKGFLKLWGPLAGVDRKSTRLNSSHVKISYAVFCLKT